jgi:hypothetical protein
MELSRFLSYSILVDEIEKIGRLAWSPATQHERNIATCRKVRATFDQLSSLVEAEAEIELIVTESW